MTDDDIKALVHGALWGRWAASAGVDTGFIAHHLLPSIRQALTDARREALETAAADLVQQAYAAPYGTDNRGRALITAEWLRARAMEEVT